MTVLFGALLVGFPIVMLLGAWLYHGMSSVGYYAPERNEVDPNAPVDGPLIAEIGAARSFRPHSFGGPAIAGSGSRPFRPNAFGGDPTITDPMGAHFLVPDVSRAYAPVDDTAEADAVRTEHESIGDDRVPSGPSPRFRHGDQEKGLHAS